MFWEVMIQNLFLTIYILSRKQVASENNLALRYIIEGRYKGSQGTGISFRSD
jgi:hypothetical protein